MADNVNNPKHYTQHPSGIECIEITEHMSFCLGNAMKYIWRANLKGNAIEDLEKAKWYIEREIDRLSKDEFSEKEAAIMGRFNEKIESYLDYVDGEKKEQETKLKDFMEGASWLKD